MIFELAYNGDFNGKELTPQMLKEVAETFGERQSIPIVKGHDKSMWLDDLPADGWVKDVYTKRKNGKTFLMSDEIELLEPLNSEYEEGRYKHWSIGIARKIHKDVNSEGDNYTYGKWYLFHLAMLGASIPAVPGLKDLTNSNKKSKVAASDDNENVFIFSDDNGEFEKMYFSFDMPDKIVDKTDDNNKSTEDSEMDKELQKQNLELAQKNELAQKELEALKAEKEDYKNRMAAFELKEKERKEKLFTEAKENFTNTLKEKAIQEELMEKMFKAESKTDMYNIFSEILENLNPFEKQNLAGGEFKDENNVDLYKLQKEMKI